MIFTMAWRNVWRNKVRSILIMLSIAIGLFAGMAVLSLYKGMMNSRIRTVVDAETGHLQVHDVLFKADQEPQFFLNNGAGMLVEISKIPEVKLVAPRTLTHAMLTTTTGSAGVYVIGVSPELEYKASHLQDKIKEGNGFSRTRKNEIFIGKKLAIKLKLKTGAKLVLTFTDVAGEIVSGAFRVAAIYQSDNAPLDERNVYVIQDDLNSLLNIGAAFHEIVILLKKDEDVAMVQQRLLKAYPTYRVESWKEISPEMDLMVKTVDQYSFIIIVIIMIALAFGITNTMLMAILERTREIGMMVALGMVRTKIFLLVLLETGFLTLAGLPFGMLASWGVISYFNSTGLDLSGMGTELMSSFGFNTIIYPEFPADKLAGISFIVAGTTVVSCFYPAIKALRLQPVEALKR